MFGSPTGSPADPISDLASLPMEKTGFNVDLNLFDEFYLSDPLNTFEGLLAASGWLDLGHSQLVCGNLCPITSNEIRVFECRLVGIQ